MKAFSPYLKTVFISFLSVMFFVAAVNYMVNPYGVFASKLHESMNLSRTEVVTHEKITKTMRTAMLRPDAIILGSSRAEIALDPGDMLHNINSVSYNLALARASAYMINRYFQHAEAIHPLKAVVIGLDFFSFNDALPLEKDFHEEFLAVSASGESNMQWLPKIVFSALFSWDAISDAFKTLQQQRSQDDQDIDPKNGVRIILPKLHHRYRLGTHRSFIRNETEYIENSYFLGSQHQYIFSSSLEYLKQIVERCRQQRIELKLFISPVHARQLEVIRALGLWPVFEQWKRELVRILDEDAKEHSHKPFPLWDYSGYNSVTTETVPESGQMQFYYDSAHYTLLTGKMIMERIFSVTPSRDSHADFGRLLSADNIKEVLHAIRKERENYIKNHHEAVQEIKSLVKKSGILDRDVKLLYNQILVGARLLSHSGQMK